MALMSAVRQSAPSAWRFVKNLIKLAFLTWLTISVVSCASWFLDLEVEHRKNRQLALDGCLRKESKARATKRAAASAAVAAALAAQKRVEAGEDDDDEPTKDD